MLEKLPIYLKSFYRGILSLFGCTKKKDTGIDDKFLVSNANIDKNAAIYSQRSFLACVCKPFVFQKVPK